MSILTKQEKELFKTRSLLGKIKLLLGSTKRKFINLLYSNLPVLKPVYQTKDNINPITIKHLIDRKIFRKNREIYWPVHSSSVINGIQNIYVGIDVAPGYANGCYIQAIGKVYIDDYAQISPNVGIISANHNILNLRKHDIGEVYIGKYCWIGMNSVVLPNVRLGDFTIVQAGSVVNKSFESGYCIIGGNPATIIKQFPDTAHHLFERYESVYKYNGFIPHNKFEAYRKKHLKV